MTWCRVSPQGSRFVALIPCFLVDTGLKFCKLGADLLVPAVGALIVHTGITPGLLNLAIS